MVQFVSGNETESQQERHGKMPVKLFEQWQYPQMKECLYVETWMADYGCGTSQRAAWSATRGRGTPMLQFGVSIGLPMARR
jgi:glutamate formiminotransferase